MTTLLALAIAPLAISNLQTPDAPSLPHTETEVTFPGAGLTLAGTLALPAKHPAPHPAVLLLPGSGPTDRDGNQAALKTDILKQLAHHLASKGYATLRFDKRPVARYSSHWPVSEPAKLSEFFSVPNHLADVRAAYTFLSDRPEVDKSKVAILGHSEGGLFAIQLAAELQPAALLLLGTPGRNMGQVLTAQITRNIRQSSLPVPDQDAILKNLANTLAALESKPELPAGIHPILAPLFNPSTPHIMHGYLRARPLADAAAYPGPVLVANGASDVQVDPELDARPLADSFNARKPGQATLLIIPQTSHNFKPVLRTTDPGFTGPIDPALLAGLDAFLAKNLPRP